MLYAALPYFVYARTGSALATAGMIVAELAPAIALESFAGVFVDRWNRKHVVVVGNLLEAAAVALLLLVPGGWIGFVYVAAAAQSTVAAFANPAESALLPTLVPQEKLVPANALNALNNRIGRLVGLPLGAAVLAAIGLRGVVLADCATFVAAAGLVATIDAPRRHDAREKEPATDEARSLLAPFRREWIDGLRLVSRDRTLAVLFFVLGLMTFGGTMLDPLVPPWVRDVLGGGPEVYAWLMAAHAASGIVGALLVGRLGGRLSPRVLMGWSSVVACVVLLVRFNVASIPVALVLAVPSGITSVASAVGVETLVQQSIRDEYRGRVFGALGASGALLSLLGAATGGALAEIVGIVPMLDVAAVLGGVAGIVVLRAFGRPSGRRRSARRTDAVHSS